MRPVAGLTSALVFFVALVAATPAQARGRITEDRFEPTDPDVVLTPPDMVFTPVGHPGVPNDGMTDLTIGDNPAVDTDLFAVGTGGSGSGAGNTTILNCNVTTGTGYTIGTGAGGYSIVGNDTAQKNFDIDCTAASSATGILTCLETRGGGGGSETTLFDMACSAAGGDTTPDAFTFTDQAAVPLSSLRTSNTITITGITAAAAISVSGGGGSEYSIGCTATFTTTAGTINNNETVCVRHTSAATQGTATNTTLTVGGVSDIFTSTTEDTTPDAFTFTDVNNVALSSTQTSNTVTITGITAPAAISVAGGGGSAYSIGCTGTFTTTAGTINNNETVCVRHTASALPATNTDTTLTVGGVSDTFTSTTVGPDLVPDAFTFTDQTNVALATPITSNTVTITGINAATAIAVSGDATSEYDIGCDGGFTNVAGTINNNETVCVRHTSAATPATATNTTLTVGGVMDTFTSTTAAGDTTPDAFTFTDQTNVALSTPITSNTVTITGIDTATPISVSGAASSEYDIGCDGGFTSAPGTVMNNDTVCVRHTSAATPLTATNTTLTVGGVSDTFTSTTGDTTPDAFTFVDETAVPLSSVRTSNTVTITGTTIPTAISVSGAGQYSIGCTGTFTAAPGTIMNNETVCVRHTSAATPATATNTTLTVGGVSDTFTSTTIDTVPNAFTFTDQTNVALSTPTTSNTVTITGIDTATPISVSGAASSEYSIGCTGTFTSTAGTITNGQTVCVRHTSAATPATMTNTTLDVGGVTDTFTTTTVAADTTPDAFTFTDQTAVPLNSLRTSNTVTITGINTAAAISVAGGGGSEYSIGCTGTFTTTAGTINNGETVCVRHTSAATEATATNTTLTIGGVSDTFTSTTADLTPAAFAFTDQTNVALSTPITSNTVTITGIDSPTSIAVSGDATSEYSIGCTGTFTNVAGTISNGQTVCVRHTSSAAFSTAVNTTLTVGGVADTFTTTTLAADTTPDPFTFTDVSNQPAFGPALPPFFTTDPFIQSNTVTITGLNTTAPISVSGAAGSEYSIGCTGVFTSVAGTISNGQTVCVRHPRPPAFATTTNTTLTIGGVSDTFTSSTFGVDATPDPFVFTDQTNVARSTVIVSNTVTINGITPGVAISVTGGEYSIGCTGTFTATPGTVNPGDTVCVRHTSAATFSTNTDTTLTVGTVSDTFTSTTLAQDTTPGAFAFVDQTNVARSTPITSNTVTISGINDPAPISVSGDPTSEYSIGCTGTFTNAPGTISDGQTVCVRHTSAATFSTTVDTTLNVGGVTDTFSSTTLAQDTTPDPFVFTDVTNVPLSSVQTSNTVTITGINDPAPISVVGGTYSIGCTGTFTAVAGTISNGQTVCVQHTASAIPATTTNTTLTVGGVSDTFSSTTVGPDTTPDPFDFIDQFGVQPNTQVISNTVAITGINTGTPVTVTNGGYSIGCTGVFTTLPGTINPGQTICVSHTSAGVMGNTVTTTLTIGGVSATFSSQTFSVAVPTLSELGRWMMILLVLSLGLIGFRQRTAG